MDRVGELLDFILTGNDARQFAVDHLEYAIDITTHA